MGVDLRMEPYATMFEKERPESRIIPELCLPDVDKLFESLGLSLDEFHALADKEGRLPHEAALRLFKKGQIGGTLAHYYSQWYEHPNLLPSRCGESQRAARLAWRAKSAISPTLVPG